MNLRAADERRTVILLGASNLTLGWKPLLQALFATVPEPLDVRVALGMGRSYIDWSAYFARQLPGIVNCGLWRDLNPQCVQPPLVLVTDVGNDIVYGHDPEKIHAAVDTCLTRILDWRSDARVVMTGLPLSSISSLTPLRFAIARTLLFPAYRASLDEIRRKAEEVDQRARELAERYKIPCVIPEQEWYGADPIHVLRPLRETVFRYYFSHWQVRPAAAPVILRNVPGLPRSAERTVFGVLRQRLQPVFQSRDLIVSAW